MKKLKKFIALLLMEKQFKMNGKMKNFFKFYKVYRKIRIIRFPYFSLTLLKTDESVLLESDPHI